MLYFFNIINFIQYIKKEVSIVESNLSKYIGKNKNFYKIISAITIQ